MHARLPFRSQEGAGGTIVGPAVCSSNMQQEQYAAKLPFWKASGVYLNHKDWQGCMLQIRYEDVQLLI